MSLLAVPTVTSFLAVTFLFTTLFCLFHVFFGRLFAFFGGCLGRNDILFRFLPSSLPFPSRSVPAGLLLVFPNCSHLALFVGSLWWCSLSFRPSSLALASILASTSSTTSRQDRVSQNTVPHTHTTGRIYPQDREGAPDCPTHRLASICFVNASR